MRLPVYTTRTYLLFAQGYEARYRVQLRSFTACAYLRLTRTWMSAGCNLSATERGVIRRSGVTAEEVNSYNIYV